MHVFRRKLGLISALSILAFSGGCSGFFVSPTLSSIAVGPTATIQQNRTVQMFATGTFTDGTTTNSVSNLFWSTDNDAIASISSSGLVTGVGPGTATITAASGSVSGTATVTVSVGNITSIMIRTNPQGQSTVKAGDQLQFQALATTSGGQTNLDVTNSVQWNVQEGSATGCCSISSTGLLTTMSGITGPVTVTAQDRLSGTTGQLAITIQ